jgi:hypothetical protein
MRVGTCSFTQVANVKFVGMYDQRYGGHYAKIAAFDLVGNNP